MVHSDFVVLGYGAVIKIKHFIRAQKEFYKLLLKEDEEEDEYDSDESSIEYSSESELDNINEHVISDMRKRFKVDFFYHEFSETTEVFICSTNNYNMGVGGKAEGIQVVKVDVDKLYKNKKCMLRPTGTTCREHHFNRIYKYD